jgi:hypothetical protein
MHIVGHPENIVLVEGGVASLSTSELLRYSVDKDDVTGAGEQLEDILNGATPDRQLRLASSHS